MCFLQWTQNLVYTYWNKAMEDLMNIKSYDAIGKSIYEILPDSQQTRETIERSKRVMKNKQVETYISEFQVENELQYFEISIYPNLDGISVFTKNITKRIESELKLKNSEYKLKAILKSTNDGNLLISKDYKILSFNKAAQNATELVFGKKMKENDSIFDFVVPKDVTLFIEHTQRVLKGEVIKLEREVNNLWFEFYYFPVYDDDDNEIGFSMNIANIVDRKNSELKLSKQNEMLQKIAWQHTHELRTPVVNILGLCDVMRDFKSETDEARDNYIDYLVQSINQLDKIIHRIVNQAEQKELRDEE